VAARHAKHAKTDPVRGERASSAGEPQPEPIRVPAGVYEGKPASTSSAEAVRPTESPVPEPTSQVPPAVTGTSGPARRPRRRVATGRWHTVALVAGSVLVAGAVGALALRGHAGSPAGGNDREGVAQALASPLGRSNTSLPPIAAPSGGAPSAGPNSGSSAAGALRSLGSTPSPDESRPGADSRSGPGADATAGAGSDATPDPDPGPGQGSDTAPQIQDTTAARSTMQAWLRGLGYGDTSICYRYATEDFVEREFGSMDRCRRHVDDVEDHNRRDEVRALRTTTVVGATVENGTVVVRFSDLRWSSGYMTAETTQERHRLGLVDGDWKILG
jgi:hypothetical protein